MAPNEPIEFNIVLNPDLGRCGGTIWVPTVRMIGGGPKLVVTIESEESDVPIIVNAVCEEQW